MALTRHPLAELTDETIRQVDLGPVTRSAPLRVVDMRSWATEPAAVSRRWGRGLAVAWVVVYTAAVLLEPAPADPNAAEPLWAVALFLSLTGVLVAMGIGLSRGRRIGLVAGVAAAGLALFGAVMCPVSAHHAGIGAWWFLQMAGFVGLMAATVVGLRRSRSAS